MKLLLAFTIAILGLSQIQSLADDNNMSSSAAGTGVLVPTAQQSNSGQTGKAVLNPTADGKTQVVITLTGTPTGSQEPAHIHRGTCRALDAKPAFPLSTVVDGKSTTIIDTPIKSLQSGQYAINVHQSTSNLGYYVACGNIPQPPGAMPAAPPNPGQSPAAQPSSMPTPSATYLPLIRSGL
jgi:hypothetical protein